MLRARRGAWPARTTPAQALQRWSPARLEGEAPFLVATCLVGKAPEEPRQLRGSRVWTLAPAQHIMLISPSGLSIGIQMSELMRLLLKAVRSLPQDEQDAVLTELLSAKVLTGRPEKPGQPGQVSLGLDPQWPSLTAMEITQRVRAGGPWQTVPTRLSVEQYEQLKQWCQANGFTMAVVLRGLVERFLDEQERRPKPGSDEAGEASA
jgi:hypothetical protein